MDFVVTIVCHITGTCGSSIPVSVINTCDQVFKKISVCATWVDYTTSDIFVIKHGFLFSPVQSLYKAPGLRNSLVTSSQCTAS